MRDHTITPPEPQVTLFQCRVCEEDTPAEYMSEFNNICEGCEWGYIKSKAAALAQDFIPHHKSEFYLSWWFGNLPTEERLEIVESAYWMRRAFNQNFDAEVFESMRNDEADFCFDHMLFADYVKEIEHASI